MKLIENTEFGLQRKAKEKEFKTRLEYLDWYEKSRNNYDVFLNQPLTLGMFVPCDEDGNVLEEPIYKEYCNKVLFEGFENYFFELKEHNVFVINEKIFSTNDKIENLLEYKGLEFKLTPNAIKQLKLWI